MTTESRTSVGPASDTDPDVDPDRLLAAARRGSNRAWAMLLEDLDPIARRLAHVVLDRGPIDDVLLGAYVRAYRARRLDPERARAFVAHHVWVACGHELRRQARRRRPAPGRRAERPGASSAPGLGPGPVAEVVGGLRPAERAVWVLGEVEGLDDDEAASALGVEPEVIARVRARVRRRLESDQPSATSVPEPDDEPDGDDEPEGRDEPAAEGEDEPEPEGEGEGEDEGEPEKEVDPEGSDPEGAADPELAPDAGLEPPPHGPGFWPELGGRLRAAREAPEPAPPPPAFDPDGPSPALTTAKPPPLAMQKRAPRRARKENPDLVEELADEADRQRTRRSRLVLLRGAAVATLVIGVIGAGLVALVLSASRAKSPVRANSVASLTVRSADVLGDADGYSAAYERTVVTGGERTISAFSVVRAADGSYLLGEAGVGSTAFDATEDTRRQTPRGEQPGRVDVGLAPGAPDPNPAIPELPDGELGLATRILSEIDDEEAVSSTLGGREVWRLAGDIPNAPEGAPDRVEYLVDRDQLLPVRLRFTREGRMLRGLSFTNIELNPVLPPFTVDLGETAPTLADNGFESIDIESVEADVRFAPPVPRYLPDDFEFVRATVSTKDRVASVLFQRGFRRLTITLRPSPVGAGQVWEDPFSRSAPIEPSQVEITEGPYRGESALRVVAVGSEPSLWGADGTMAFTVAGDVSGDDLVRVVESLR